MNDDFFIEETWAGYKNLSVENKRLSFVYGWEDVDQEYLKKVVEKYPETFLLEVTDNDTSLLKLKSFDNLKIETLLNVVDGDNSDRFELVDLETKKLLNSDKIGQGSSAVESLNLV